MTREQNEHLADCCGWNLTEEVLLLLQTDSSLDILYRNADSLFYAVKWGNTEILSTLLYYYKKYKLNAEKNTTEYKTNLDSILKSLYQINDSCMIT